jgi:hypothetical protein
MNGQGYLPPFGTAEILSRLISAGLEGPVQRSIGLGKDARGFRRASVLALLPSGLNRRTLGLADYCSRHNKMKTSPSPQFQHMIPRSVGQYIASRNLELPIPNCLLSYISLKSVFRREQQMVVKQI